jgi:hypothetical protein
VEALNLKNHLSVVGQDDFENLPNIYKILTSGKYVKLTICSIGLERTSSDEFLMNYLKFLELRTVRKMA